MGKGNGKRVCFLLTDDTGRERVVTPVRRRGPRPRKVPTSSSTNHDGNYDNVKVKIVGTLGEVKKLGIFPRCQVNLERCTPPPPTPQPEVASSSSRILVLSRGGHVTTSLQRYYCDQCTKHYASKRSLSEHKKFHKDPNRFRCNICGKRYQGGLRYHRKTHLGFQPGGLRLDPLEKPFHCTVCGNRYINVSHLYYHAKMHARCQLGGNAYRRKNGHAAPKRFRCVQCSTSFVLKTDLDHHLTFHRRNQGV